MGRDRGASSKEMPGYGQGEVQIQEDAIPDDMEQALQDIQSWLESDMSASSVFGGQGAHSGGNKNNPIQKRRGAPKPKEKSFLTELGVSLGDLLVEKSGGKQLSKEQKFSNCRLTNYVNVLEMVKDLDLRPDMIVAIASTIAGIEMRMPAVLNELSVELSPLQVSAVFFPDPNLGQRKNTSMVFTKDAVLEHNILALSGRVDLLQGFNAIRDYPRLLFKAVMESKTPGLSAALIEGGDPYQPRIVLKKANGKTLCYLDPEKAMDDTRARDALRRIGDLNMIVSAIHQQRRAFESFVKKNNPTGPIRRFTFSLGSLLSRDMQQVGSLIKKAEELITRMNSMMETIESESGILSQIRSYLSAIITSKQVEGTNSIFAEIDTLKSNLRTLLESINRFHEEAKDIKSIVV